MNEDITRCRVTAGRLLIAFAAIGISGCAELAKQWAFKTAVISEGRAAYFQDKQLRREARYAEYTSARAARLGTVQEYVETDLTLPIQNNIAIGDFGLDFKELGRMAKRQATFDEEYAEARDAWEAYEDARRKAFGADQVRAAKARNAKGGPDCARPAAPRPAYAPSPAPQRL